MKKAEDKKAPVGHNETARQCASESARERTEAMVPTDRKEYRQTVRILIKMLVTVFLCEAAVMALLQTLPLKRGWHVIADPLLLTILSTPLLYWLLVRPVEELVKARTEELTQVNRQLLEEIVRRRALEKELLSIVERERQRTGRELHDGIGQQLTGIAFMIETLEQKLSMKSLAEEASYAGRINERVNQAADQTHNLVRGLQPIDLERSGLASALEDLAADTQQLFNVSCTFLCEPPVSVSGVAVAANLYRIAQEAITNAIKHGKARAIKLELSDDEESVRLTVVNDGLGFPAGPTCGKGMGLSIMRYRAEMIDGSLDIRKGRDGGTKVTCVVSKGTGA